MSLWIGIGALTGGIAVGLTAATGGGTVTDIAVATAAGVAGGVVANAFKSPLLGAAVGVSVAGGISQGVGLFQQGFNTPVP